MKLQIENLKKLIAGENINGYQLQEATNEFYKLLKYAEELEKMSQPLVNNSCKHDWVKSTAYKNARFCNKCGKYQ